MGGKGKKRGDVKQAEARITTADAAVMAAMAGALHQKAGYGQTPAAPTPQQQQQRAQPKDGTHAAPYVQHTTEQLRKHLDQQQRQPRLLGPLDTLWMGVYVRAMSPG